ncbi:Bis-ABC ATPase Glov_0246 [Olavius sp. associated proteobacterium Delta 1]|nr:Bis-ABC ATPase Glov_0246 [Olavius sp. associated proteobacterium Delta 1]
MADLSISFHNLSFTYDRATQPLFHDLSVHFIQGWTGIVGANGVGKSTILKLATEGLKPQKGRVVIPEFAIYCQQRTDMVPDHLYELIHSMDGDAFEIKGRLGLEDDWIKRWATLSHGERKRAQIAVALWRKPQVLAVDEPTNHLDSNAQDLLFAALSSFHGVGMLVSHDRKFLDDLCHQCLFVEPPHAILRPGNYTHGLQLAERDEMFVTKNRHQAKQALSRIKHEATKRRDAASQADRKRSKRGLVRKDHDAKGKIYLARVTGKDGSDGKRLNQLEGRLSQARMKMDRFKVKKKYELGIWMSGVKSKRNTLFNLPAGSLSLGGDRLLHYPDISMKPAERIALTGSNGSGKSTLIEHIMQSLNLKKDHVIYLPQEIGIHASQDIMTEARVLPNEKLGQMMTVVSCLGSRPHRLLDSVEPSPGEIRKILIATGIANVPHLIVMDEPTNHLDLPSIECLEQALADCPCGLFLASHDLRFLDALVHIRWHISENSRIRGNYILEI